MNDSRKYVLVLSLTGLLMLVLNLLTVHTLSDDILYRFEWQRSEAIDWPLMEHIGQLIPSQFNHYIIVSGRFIVHLIGQFFLNFVPFHVFHVINALMFVALIALSVKVMRIEGERRWMAATWLFCLLFFVIRGFQGAMLWSIGSFNYLWVLVSTLLFALYIERVKDRDINALSWLMCPIALLVGWSHEALSLPLSVAIFTFSVVKRKNILHQALFPVFLGYMVGTFLCLSSPGMWTRVSDSPTIQSKILSGAVNLVTNIRIFYLLLFALAWQYKADRVFLRRHLSVWFYVYVALLTALCIVIGCGTTLERVGFYVDFLSALLLTSLLFTKETSRIYNRFTVGLLLLILLFSFPVLGYSWQNYQNYQDLKHQLLAPDKTLIRVHEPPSTESFLSRAVRSRYTMPSVDFGFNNCYQAFNHEDINIRCAARLNGKSRVCFLPDGILDKIDEDSTAFTNYELDGQGNLFVWRLKDGQPSPRRLIFQLAAEDISQLPLRSRVILYHGDSYELDPLKFSVVSVNNRRYLVFTKPVTCIYRRISSVICIP